jgi:hypothetical protein
VKNAYTVEKDMTTKTNSLPCRDCISVVMCYTKIRDKFGIYSQLINKCSIFKEFYETCDNRDVVVYFFGEWDHFLNKRKDGLFINELSL